MYVIVFEVLFQFLDILSVMARELQVPVNQSEFCDFANLS